MRKIVVPVGVVLLACVVLLVVSGVFLRPNFDTFNSQQTASVLQSRANVSVTGGKPSQQWLVQLETGGQLWVSVPPTAAGTRGRKVTVDVWCTDESAKRCMARLAR